VAYEKYSIMVLSISEAVIAVFEMKPEQHTEYSIN